MERVCSFTVDPNYVMHLKAPEYIRKAICLVRECRILEAIETLTAAESQVIKFAMLTQGVAKKLRKLMTVLAENIENKRKLRGELRTRLLKYELYCDCLRKEIKQYREFVNRAENKMVEIFSEVAKSTKNVTKEWVHLHRSSELLLAAETEFSSRNQEVSELENKLFVYNLEIQLAREALEEADNFLPLMMHDRNPNNPIARLEEALFCYEDIREELRDAIYNRDRAEEVLSGVKLSHNSLIQAFLSLQSHSENVKERLSMAMAKHISREETVKKAEERLKYYMDCSQSLSNRIKEQHEYLGSATQAHFTLHRLVETWEALPKMVSDFGDSVQAFKELLQTIKNTKVTQSPLGSCQNGSGQREAGMSEDEVQLILSAAPNLESWAKIIELRDDASIKFLRIPCSCCFHILGGDLIVRGCLYVRNKMLICSTCAH